MAPSYRERLKVEGLTMAASGAIASVALLAAVPESRQRAVSTVAQLAVVAALLEGLGSRSVRKWMDAAAEAQPGGEGSGEPTPLWQMPVIMSGLAAVFILLPETNLAGSDAAGWDAGLRVTGGCLLVGLAQGLRYERIVAADETRRGRRYVRAPGSRLLKGTLLVFTRGG